MSTPLERAAEAVRTSRAFHASAVFGIPSDVHHEASLHFARAALEAAIDEEEIAEAVLVGFRDTEHGFRLFPEESVAAIKAHLLGGAE